jgi:hypothetical protein
MRKLQGRAVVLITALWVALALAGLQSGCDQEGTETRDNVEEFVDATSDQLNSSAVPDLTTVEVSNTQDTIAFRVTIGNYSTFEALPNGSAIAIVVDSDRDPSTGVGGVDARLNFEKKPDGSKHVSVERRGRSDQVVVVPEATKWVTFTDSVLEWRVPREELVVGDGFAFAIFSFLEEVRGSGGGVDYAPNDPPLWEYDL